jgi:hypothetical protein
MTQVLRRPLIQFALIGATIAAIAATLFATQPSAQASVPNTFCNGRTETWIARNYTRGAATLPLRCGNVRWGFQHITARWNAGFDANIALTISRGEYVTDFQQDGGSGIYALFSDRCTELFRVIYNGGALNGTGVRPQGIITAYAPSGAAFAPTDESISAAAGFRTDCEVKQRI